MDKGNGDGEGKIREISAEELKNVRNGIVEIDIPNDIEEILLPGAAGVLLDGHLLAITVGDVRIELSSELLRRAAAEADMDEQSQLSLHLRPLSTSRSERIIGEAAARAHAQLNAASGAYDIELSLIAADGSRIPVQWSGDVEEGIDPQFDPSALSPKIAFKIPASMDRELLGIYFIDSKGELNYVGGKVKGNWMETVAVRPGQYLLLEYNKSFVDVTEDFWAARVIKALAARHIVEGISDTHFAPEKPVTRAEFTALLVRNLRLQAHGSSLFSDVAADTWYSKVVAAAVGAGLVNGISDDLFAPDDPISREQMATMLIRAYEIGAGKKVSGEVSINSVNRDLGGSRSTFVDQDEISDWALSYVRTAQQLGLLQGKENNRFDPQTTTNRAESAQAIYNLMQSIE